MILISHSVYFSISDNLTQFLLIPQDTHNHNTRNRDFKNFNKETFIGDILGINWQDLLQVGKADPNISFENMDKKINEIIDAHAHLQNFWKKSMRYRIICSLFSCSAGPSY